MIIDLTPLVQALAALALTALVSTTPYLVPLLRRFLHIQLDATQASAIQSAADAGAQAAYGYIATNAASYRNPTKRHAYLSIKTLIHADTQCRAQGTAPVQAPSEAQPWPGA